MDANAFVDAYLSWLKQNTITNQLANDVVEISAPFLDRHNDYIQLYIAKDKDGFILTDDGYTISDLEMSGLTFHTQKRKEELKTILNGFGVSTDQQGNLFCKCHASDFPEKKHSLIQAILAVNDLFVLSQSNVISIFTQDVEHFLQAHDIRYTKNANFRGKSGFAHAYDFVIPSSKHSPERLIRTINNLDRTNTQNVIFAWNDTVKMRSKDTKLFAFVNDIKKEPAFNCMDALREYNITPISWAEREKFIPELAA